MRKIVIFFVTVFMGVNIVSGQATCPANVLLALARAATTCAEVEGNQACYGNGTITPQVYAGQSATFAQPGHKVDIGALEVVTLASSGTDDVWSVLTLRARANLPAVQQRDLMLMAFGNVTLHNLVLPVPRQRVPSIAAVVYRATPDVNAEIIGQQSVGSEVMANGQTADGRWLRVLMPDSDEVAWVAVDLLKDTGYGALNVVDVMTPVEQPFQRLIVTTGAGDAFCTNAPESGVLLQAPDTTTEVILLLNHIETHIAGTVFVQSDGTATTFTVLNGQVVVHGQEARQLIPAGTFLTVEADAAPGLPQPYDLLRLAALPYTNLQYRLALAQPLTQAAINNLLITFNATPTPTPDPDLVTDDTGCRFILRRNTSLRAGPGSFYEVLRDLSAGRRLYPPVLGILDADGVVWWQLRSSAWIDSRTLEVSPDCEPVPMVERVAPPMYNTLIMETCATTNGPLRAGQYVLLEFTPPAWEFRDEAINAPTIDPGRFTIDRRMRLHTYWSNIVQLGEKSFVRTFYGDWEATAGVHRIISKRLSYELICDFTVPAGG